MAEQKTYEFKVYTDAQDWEGTVKCNGGDPQIIMSPNLNCSKEQEEAFHRLLTAHINLSRVCGNVNKIEFELKL